MSNKAREIEEALLRRMEERYRDGDVCDEIREFFERSGDPNEIPLLMGARKRKQRSLRNVGGEGSPGKGPADVTQTSTALYPPPTNRGVTFHGDAETPESEETTAEDCPHTMGGYDGGIEIGFDGHWNADKFTALKAVLLKAKEAAAETPDAPERFVELGGKMFVVSARSAGGQLTYKFMFEGDGVKFYVHNNPSKFIQPIRLRYNAEGLIGRDIFFKHAETLEFLKSLGFTVKQEKISRVDLQVMLFRRIEEFMAAVNEGRIVCTARNYKVFGSGFNACPQTFTLGSAIQICIYDKRAELFSSMESQSVKFALMVQECFGDDWLSNEIPTTRIEFRIKRSVLKTMEIDTMDDLLEHEAGLARYCCNSWFRMTEERKIKGHTHEQATSELWQEVQAAFEKWFPGVEGHRKEVRREYRKTPPQDGDGLLKQSGGCLASYIAKKYGEVENPRKLFSYVMRSLELILPKMFSKSLDRAREWGVRFTNIVTEELQGACATVIDPGRWLSEPVFEEPF